MRYVVIGCALLLFGCATYADPGQRAVDNIGCIVQLAGAVGPLAADPAVAAGTRGEANAIEIANAIHTAGTSNISVETLAACKDTLGYASQDVQSLRERVKARTAK